MCSGCKGNAVVAASNIAYFALAYWMWKNGLHLWWVLIIVGAVSIVFHLEPSSKKAYWTDIVIANLAILSFFLYYRNSLHDKALILYGAAAFIVSIFLFFFSGDDREESRYVVMHSLWHVLTAIACYLFVKSTITQKRIEGGFKPPGSLLESLLSLLAPI